VNASDVCHPFGVWVGGVFHQSLSDDFLQREGIGLGGKKKKVIPSFGQVRKLGKRNTVSIFADHLLPVQKYGGRKGGVILIVTRDDTKLPRVGTKNFDVNHLGEESTGSGGGKIRRLQKKASWGRIILTQSLIEISFSKRGKWGESKKLRNRGENCPERMLGQEEMPSLILIRCFFYIASGKRKRGVLPQSFTCNSN